MKKIFFLIIITFFFVQTNACPFCGCGVGNFYMGLLPNFKNQFIGVRYQYMHYYTQVADDASQFTNDYYRTVEIWGGWNINNKWQVLAFIPYQFNTQNTDDGVIKQNGLGDITLLTSYKLFHSTKLHKNNKSSTVQELRVGAGIKLPTGKYKLDPEDPDANLGDVNSQMGTGSVDFLLNASYNISINKFGINTSVNYKMNTTNNQHYQFGNRLYAAALGYYNIQLHNVIIAPNAGVLYEHAGVNHLNKETVDETGGYAAFGVAGIEISYKKISIGANAQMPFSQDFAHGQTETKLRGMAHITFSF